MTATPMIPARLTPKRVTSEKRAAASRANGAKSRGPVTAHGKANSSRNSHRHGLRSRIPLFTGPAYQAGLAANLTAFERDFKAQSSIERRLVNSMAVADWRRTCLFKLEIDMLNSESTRVESLFAIYRLDGRYERQYEAAYNALTAHRAFLRECAAGQFPKNIKMTERTRQVTETTGAPAAPPSETTISNPADHLLLPEKAIKVKVTERTRQTAKNTEGLETSLQIFPHQSR